MVSSLENQAFDTQIIICKIYIKTAVFAMHNDGWHRALRVLS